GAVVSVTLMLLYQLLRLMMGLPEPAVPENPIIDILAGKTAPWLIILLMLLASLWAPLVEESVFRGALYRQLRSRWHWFPAALVSWMPTGSSAPSSLAKPPGRVMAGRPAKFTPTVYTSSRYIASGSAAFWPSLNAGVGELGMRMAWQPRANAAS